MTLQRKLLVSKLGLALVPLAVTSAVLLWRVNAGFRNAVHSTETVLDSNTKRSREALISAAAQDLSHIAKDVYATCQAQQELLQQKVSYDLNVARRLVQEAGKVNFAQEKIAWEAVDQLTNKSAHTAESIAVGDWTHAYSREVAVYPLRSLVSGKYWPPVRRIDQAYGDRNLVCACPPVEAFA